MFDEMNKGKSFEQIEKEVEQKARKASREEGKTWAIEACIALGIQSYKGKTTHGNRPIQLMKQIPEGHDLYYIQYSETDQKLHEMGTSRETRKGLLRNVDGNMLHANPALATMLEYDNVDELLQLNVRDLHTDKKDKFFC